MTLLDRFRAGPRHKHPDPVVRLAHVTELPISDRETIDAIAREDDDARVRRAAVGKLMDPGALGRIARDDQDADVRAAAAAMLRDIALEAFEGIGEAEALDAVDALTEAPILAQVAKTAGREIVALRALSRVGDTRHLGSIARHAAGEAVRRGALSALRDRGESSEILAVAMHAEHKDAAVAAVDLLGDRLTLEQIAARSKSRPAVKRARALLKEMDDQMAALHETETTDAAPTAAFEPLPAPEVDLGLDEQKPALEEAPEEAAAPQVATDAGPGTGRPPVAEQEAESARARLEELATEIEAAVVLDDPAERRKRMAHARREWDQLSPGTDTGIVADRVNAAVAQWVARENEAREADERARRDALARLHALLRRVEPLVDKADVSAKAADRALRDIRAALGDVPPLPSKEDAQDVARRLKTVQSALQPKLQELREAEEWQRWANATIQEQLCVKMEALQALDDPDRMAREVRELQQQWREAADVPRAQADALWRRFKTAHDVVWGRCEASFAARAETFRENLRRKVALCERVEALANSTNWLQTAEEIKALQAEWKTIGPVPRGSEKAIWERFRQPCDRFFTRRSEDLAQRKAVWGENLSKKTALCERAEALATSTEWDAAAPEIKQLQAAWKTIGPVKKARSEAIWQRFRAACDQFFTNYAQRHDTARAARLASREAVCVEFEELAAGHVSDDAPGSVLAAIRGLHGRWKQETAARGADSASARDLDQRVAAAFAQICARWPDAIRGTDFDPDANRARLEALVARVEEVAHSVSGGLVSSAADQGLSPTTRLAAMLKEALASNTIGGAVDDRSRKAAAVEEVRQAHAAWARIGPVPDAVRAPLQERFNRAGRLVMERAGSSGRPEPPDRKAARR